MKNETILHQTFEIASTGYTVTGHGKIYQIWRIMDYIGDDKYGCLLLADNTVMELSKDFWRIFDEDMIIKYNPKNNEYWEKVFKKNYPEMIEVKEEVEEVEEIEEDELEEDFDQKLKESKENN